MSNTFNVETLGHLIQSGDIETMVGGSPAAAEARTIREMQKNGMETPAVGGVSDAKGAAGSFSNMLRDSMEKVNLDQTQADKAIKELVSGKSKNIHETMLAVERADTSLKLMMQVRNKVLDAYKEIMRMQV